MKPIQSAFRLAQASLCLANEWRDTLSYIALAVGGADAFLCGQTKLLPWMFFAVTARELVRTVAWIFHKERRLAGDNSTPVSHIANSAAAVIIAGAVTVVQGVSSAILEKNPTGLVVVLPVFCISIDMASAKTIKYNRLLRDITKLYFDKKTGMWDWPRKRGGNGPTQTEKLKTGFGKLGHKLVAAVAPPRPAHGAAFTPKPALSLREPA